MENLDQNSKKKLRNRKEVFDFLLSTNKISSLLNRYLFNTININHYKRKYMKVHTTNYYDTFIEIAEDTKATHGIQPPSKEKRTVAEMQYEKEPGKNAS